VPLARRTYARGNHADGEAGARKNHQTRRHLRPFFQPTRPEPALGLPASDLVRPVARTPLTNPDSDEFSTATRPPFATPATPVCSPAP